MVKLEFDIVLNYSIADPVCDFIFNIHAAQTICQTVESENLSLNQPVQTSLRTEAVSGNRWLRLQGMTGNLTVTYSAAVIIDHVVAAPETLQEIPVAKLPDEVLVYLRPSRYCQSDRLQRMAFYEFSHIPRGYPRVQAISEWVRKRVTFRPQTSDVTTSAMDTLVEQTGVCRDFAHLMIALCRAMNIPARFATGIDYGADIALGPPDFHAYVEVYLSDRWYIFDPSGLAMPMGLVRFGTGRDAADVPFATMYGAVQSTMPLITIKAQSDASGFFLQPFHTGDVLSTDP